MNFYRFNGIGEDAQGQNSQNNKACGANGAYCDDAMSAYARFQGKSEQELMGELTSLVSRMKADGSFDVESLDKLYDTASPMLNDQQKTRMRAIIDMLKG